MALSWQVEPGQHAHCQSSTLLADMDSRFLQVFYLYCVNRKVKSRWNTRESPSFPHIAGIHQWRSENCSLAILQILRSYLRLARRAWNSRTGRTRQSDILMFSWVTVMCFWAQLALLCTVTSSSCVLLAIVLHTTLNCFTVHGTLCWHHSRYAPVNSVNIYRRSCESEAVKQ